MKEKERKRARATPPGSAFQKEGSFQKEGAFQEEGLLFERLRPKSPPPEHVLAELVTAASQAYHDGDGVAFEAAVAELVERPDVSGWRQLVEVSIAAYLRATITRTWRHGWQPADLVRAVSRRFSARHVRLLGDAIADELQAYAVVTIDPRWSAQLAEAEAEVWWAPPASYLRARYQLPNHDWVTVLSMAVELLCLVNSLGVLEQLGPIPGTARPPARTPAGGQGEKPAVDERMLSRIRALLAKAEATSSEAEAEAFTAGAQERMARHSIDLAMLAATEPDNCAKPAARRITISNPYEASKAVLLDAVSRANRCRSVWSQSLGFCTVIGFEPDLDAVETLFTSLLVQAVTAMTRAGSRTGPGGRSRTRAFRQSFLAAYAHRIGERLTEVVEVQTEAATAEPGGGNLLPVLASRNLAVDDALSSMFPTLTQKSAGSITDAEGWHSGRGAADLATLHTGQGIHD